MNAYEGSSTRRTVFNVYLPAYTNGWHGAYAEVILDPTWSISSIEMTVETFDNRYRGYTNSFNITSTSISPAGQVKGDMSLYLSTNTILKGAETTINLNYLNVTSEFGSAN